MVSRKKTKETGLQMGSDGYWLREATWRGIGLERELEGTALEKGVEGTSKRETAGIGLASRGAAEGIGFEREGGGGLASKGEAEGIGLNREKKHVEGRTKRK